MLFKFPDSFFWGAALSSYQTEGNNTNTDWFEWERIKNLEPAASASNHFFLFKQDFILAKQLNLNAIKTSIEWARIFKDQQTISEEALHHYSLLVETLNQLNLEPFITLHHFTNPLWFAKKDGWLKAKNIDFFLKYLRIVVRQLKDKVKYWLIFNEPLVYVYNSFVRGIWPPGEKSINSAKKVLSNIKEAYITGYKEVKAIYNDKPSNISFCKHMRFFSKCSHFCFFINYINTKVRDRVFNFSFLEELYKKKVLDFIAINYYCKEYTHCKGFYGKECVSLVYPERKNYLGWYVYPEGLYIFLKRLKKFNLDIIITENGTAEIEENFYKDYLLAHLKSVAEALKENIKVTGYFWWSLIDNFEWDKGFAPRFGLLKVDYTTFERQVREFAKIYAKICKDNCLEL